MLTYRRRGSSESITKITSNPNVKFLGYCNWSYTENHRINIKEAIDMLNNFNSIYIPYYVRIFNEMPSTVLNDFIERNNINHSRINIIHQTLTERTSFRIKAI